MNDAGSAAAGTDRAEAPQRAALSRVLRGIEGEGELLALLHTSAGDVHCRLLPELAPRTVANFAGLALGEQRWRHPDTDELVREPLYEDLPFHRVIPNFIVQTGDPSGTGAGGPGYTIPDEIDPRLRHDRAGTMSMANRGPQTGGSQFFITLRPLPYLDGRHAVFGYCRNIDVLRRIARAPAGPRNRPEDPPMLESIDIRRGTFESPSARRDARSEATAGDRSRRGSTDASAPGDAGPAPATE